MRMIRYRGHHRPSATMTDKLIQFTHTPTRATHCRILSNVSIELINNLNDWEKWRKWMIKYFRYLGQTITMIQWMMIACAHRHWSTNCIFALKSKTEKCIRSSFVNRLKMETKNKNVFFLSHVSPMRTHKRTTAHIQSTQWPLKLAHRSIRCVSGSCAPTSISLPHMAGRPKIFVPAPRRSRQYKSISNETFQCKTRHCMQKMHCKWQTTNDMDFPSE